MENIRKHRLDKYHFLKLLLVMYIHVYVVLGRDTKCITTAGQPKTVKNTAPQHTNFLFYCQSKGYTPVS